MSPAQLLAYLGPALVYAALIALPLHGLLGLIDRRRAAAGPAVQGGALAVAGGGAGGRRDGRHLLSLWLIAFFLVLTQHPLPDPATLDCRGGGVAPILRPFAFLDTYQRLWRQGAGPAVWIGTKNIQSSLMNFGLPALIGVALARHLGGRRPWLRALGIAVAVSGGAELLQYTALLGLYPCRYRYFEVDDLILNIGGLMTGFLAWRAWAGR